MFDSQNRYVIRNYQSKPPFTSFLPGIAGEMGVPLWCFYNNRGQAVCSFGVSDKDHAIMEFSPAHVSYRNVRYTGFRTFCKINGEFMELFTENTDMHIGMGELELRQKGTPLSASVVYYGLPGESTAALMRELRVTNTSESPISLELLDGMSAIVPFGLNQDFLKNMTQLAKAWMQAEDQEKGLAYFRVRASLEDGAVVREVKGGNFCLGWDETGTLLKPIVQSSLVFGQDTSMTEPMGFRRNSLSAITGKTQVPSNQFPCCFLPKSAVLQPGASVVLRSMYGQAESKDAVRNLAAKVAPKAYFARKRQEAAALVGNVVAPVECRTANPVFDAYAKQTYLDNALRGGAPMFFRGNGKTVPFHIYSRKHGDPEREYNYFSLGREYYAQGNGNFRDVNQNRRCDVLFAPEVGEKNIFTFFDLIQTDGYNPLVLTPSTFTLPPEQRGELTAKCPSVAEILSGAFTPGSLAMAAERSGMDAVQVQNFVAQVICQSHSEPNADFGEGYWTDHWTYNLDQIESYLTVYPERKQELLFREDSCRWYETRVLVNPRAKRCVLTERGLRQYHALDEQAKTVTHKWMHTSDGCLAKSSLIEKMILLCAIKTATLDAAGMGVEMEGGRPGWYDALNGLPGLLGSSMAESCELARLLKFTADALEQHTGNISLYNEILALVLRVNRILDNPDAFCRWDAMNRHKEVYRQQTLYGFRGDRQDVDAAHLVRMLRQMEETVLSGIRKAKEYGSGVMPTYFTFEAEEIVHTPEGPVPKKLTPMPLPLFLEGPVRYLKLDLPAQEKQSLAEKVRTSPLFDQKLGMYKVNASLQGVSYEAGRALAFTPGWLENESVWLHMEYKYLLELLKNGLYTQFAESFHTAAIPFLNPDVYGRSPLENVSFIASSANPDPDIHGRGFVARLSGSTAEFIHIWFVMFFGIHPFRWDVSGLTAAFAPCIPEYLMPEDGILKSTFLGTIPVTYYCGELPALIPGVTDAKRYELTMTDGMTIRCSGRILDSFCANALRDGKVAKIEVYFI